MNARRVRLLAESRRYPALLARLGSQRSGDADAGLNPDQLLRDVTSLCLVEDLRPEDRHTRFVEQGELGAAAALRDLEGLGGEAQQAELRHRIKLQQEIEAARRTVLGQMLLLNETGGAEFERISVTYDDLSKDTWLGEHRPGRLLVALGELGNRLSALLTNAMNGAWQELRELDAHQATSGDRDLLLAVRRAETLLASPEALPTAQRVLAVARRARDGQLSPEDLVVLHQHSGLEGRLARPRQEFPANLRTAADVARLANDPNSPARFVSPAVRNFTHEFFTFLAGVPRPRTEAIARRVVSFVGLAPDPVFVAFEGSLGSAFRFRVPVPRIPALRDTRHFAKGLQLVVPLRTDEATISPLLRDAPKECLRVVVYPARLDRLQRPVVQGADYVALLDVVDLLRLAEVEPARRVHAFQQVVLGRLPIGRLQPYQGGGPVSPEMFRGRQDVIEKLKQPRGGTVLFSGRMMGKSSILTKIHSDIQAGRTTPGGRMEQSIFVSSSSDDLLSPLAQKLIDISGARAAEFQRNEAASQPLASATPRQRHDRVVRRLQNVRAMVSGILESGQRLTILVDEADKFADADAERTRDESLAWLLRDLEHENPEKLRVVFAGFQRIHLQVLFNNGAFANWFGLVELPALSREDARSLIVEPLADFGFVFNSQATIERIVDFSGRHPLLLQEICSKLLERMAARRRNTGDDEVIFVEAGDVETVCREDQLRDRLRQVLSLNLDEYPRLKLMVYLLIFASAAAGRGGRLALDQFGLEELRETLVEFYAARFSEFFDERSISALVHELMSLGLVARTGDRYSFVNRTFAGMLRADRNFDAELERLLDVVTMPQGGDSRRFPTLANEDLEWLCRPGNGHACVVGLPGTVDESMIADLYPALEGTVRLPASTCSTVDEFKDALRKSFRETRTGLTASQLLSKNGVSRLVLSGADALAASGALATIFEELGSGGQEAVAFGGAPLCRHYVTSGLGVLSQLVPTRRLRAQDIRVWGERAPQRADEPVLVFDENTSRDLRRITAGYLPLLQRFVEFSRTEWGAAREFIPTALHVERFSRDLTQEMLSRMLLSCLDPAEVRLLECAVRAAHEYGFSGDADFDRDDFEKVVLAPLVQSSAETPLAWLDRLEVLKLLDLLEERPGQGGRTVVVPVSGPVPRALGLAR